MLATAGSIRAGVVSTPAVEATKGAAAIRGVAASKVAGEPKAEVLQQRVVGRTQVQSAADTDSMLPESMKVMASVAAPNAVPQSTQGVLDNQGAGAKGKDSEGQGHPKKKKEDKSGCFRCKQPGHHIDDCPTPFRDLCESVHHAAPTCHLLQAPKPTAILHGYANEALMFFELPCGAFKAKVENPKLAKVTVDGDALTIPEIIDQLRKIVPSDKFNWEVFHFKENIYRVKLPMEEPMYTLPEVWVRVSGLPSDIRSDYLSLWGVGTLFGKTLDVDMAYTRRNKRFFKLHFEVEEVNGSQEVDMAEVNNGNDGNDDAHNGEHNKEGGNAMDMDPKGPDDGATSNNDGQGGSINNNGIQGMHLHAHHLDEIKIGSINVQLSPSDFVPRQSTSGLPQVDSWASGSPLLLGMQTVPADGAQQRTGSSQFVEPAGDTCADAMQGEQPTDSSQQTGVCAPSTCVGAQLGPQRASRNQHEGLCAAATSAGVRPYLQHADSADSQQDIGSRVATSMRSVQRGPQAGLAVDAKAVVAVLADSLQTQKIHAMGEREGGPKPLPAKHANGNDKVMMTRVQPMIGSLGIDVIGSSAPQQQMANGGAMHLGRSMSLDNSVKGARNDYISSKMEEDGSYGLQSSMGVASSMKNKGFFQCASSTYCGGGYSFWRNT
ncbi:hypothetical protein ACQ4PT_001826 [Festuca glaucescens]